MFEVGDYIIDENGNVGQVIKAVTRSEADLNFNTIYKEEDISIIILKKQWKGLYSKCWVKKANIEVGEQNEEVKKTKKETKNVGKNKPTYEI